MNILKPTRVSRTYTQHLVAPPSAVFPLLCPVREADWIEGWHPVSVVSHSGVAERDGVFITPGTPDDSIWYITRHEPDAGCVEMLKITPSVNACRINIQLQADAGGCEATITYMHTSLGPAGDAFIDAFTEDFYHQFMLDWEARINHYLQHGVALRAIDY